MLGDLAACDAEQIVKSARLAGEVALAHREHEIAFSEHLVDAVVFHRDALLGHGLQRSTEPRQAIGDLRVVLRVVVAVVITGELFQAAVYQNVVDDAAKEVLASVRALEQVVEGHRSAPSGTLRVTLPHDPLLSAMVAPIAASLARQHPALSVELVLDDAVRDLVQDGFDLAVRLGTVAESSYIVRRLASEPEIIVASPAVLVEYDHVATPRDLRAAPWVVHSGLAVRSTRTFRSQRSEKAQISVKVSATTNTQVALRDLLLAGAGFGVAPLHSVRDDIRAGRLEHVCTFVPAGFNASSACTRCSPRGTVRRGCGYFSTSFRQPPSGSASTLDELALAEGRMAW